MPINLHIPLPGPFTYSKRITGRHKPGTHGITWWLFIGWWWKPTVWLAIGTAWLAVLACRLTVTLIRAATLAWARRQDTRTS